jgi:hypothetical protein
MPVEKLEFDEGKESKPINSIAIVMELTKAVRDLAQEIVELRKEVEELKAKQTTSTSGYQWTFPQTVGGGTVTSPPIYYQTSTYTNQDIDNPYLTSTYIPSDFNPIYMTGSNSPVGYVSSATLETPQETLDALNRLVEEQNEYYDGIDENLMDYPDEEFEF